MAHLAFTPRIVEAGALSLDEQLTRLDVPRALREAGAICLRGFGVADAAALDAALALVDPRPRRYIEGQSPRSALTARVYTSTEYPAAARIPLHHELSYTPRPPALLAFCCERAAPSGGETPLLDGVAFWASLPEALRARFEGRALRYTKVMPGAGGPGLGRTWQQHFETDDAAVVEAHLSGTGASWRWLPGGGLRVERLRPAVVAHPGSGQEVWFNQLTLWHVSWLGPQRAAALRRMVGEEWLPTQVCMDDGAPIPDAVADALRALEWAAAWRAPWREGELLLVDNLRVAHGREPFEGPRRVLVGMGDGPWT